MHNISDSEGEDQNVDQLSSETNTGNNEKQINGVKAKTEKKRMSKEEREKLRQQKLLDKLEKKKIADQWKQMKPGECLKNVTVNIDCTLGLNEYKEFMDVISTVEIQYNVIEHNTPFSITWTRKQVDDGAEISESELIVIWKYDIFIEAVHRNSLRSDLEDIARSCNKKVTLIIFGIQTYYRHHRQKINQDLKKNVGLDSNSTQVKKANVQLDGLPLLTRSQVDDALVELQLMCSVCHRFMETCLELATFITQFTKAISEKPYKLNKYKIDQNVDWYATADSKECVRIESDGSGLLRLWQQQIRQFNSVNAEMAEAIVSHYKSPTALLEAYAKCATEKEARALLKNIQLRRKFGPLSQVRKVGPELSNKLYLLFNSDDAGIPLSQ